MENLTVLKNGGSKVEDLINTYSSSKFNYLHKKGKSFKVLAVIIGIGVVMVTNKN